MKKQKKQPKFQAKKRRIKMQPVAPGILPGIGLDQLNQAICKCGSTMFTPVSMIFFASAFQTSTGTITAVNLPQGFGCIKCGKLNNYADKKKEEKINDTEQPAVPRSVNN